MVRPNSNKNAQGARGLDAARLLDQIAKSPDDVASYLVYADTLSAKNDPQGELIVLMHQLDQHPTDPHLGSALDAHLTKHRSKLFGSLGRHTGISWDFHLGFLRSVRYMPDISDDMRKVVREILALPIASVLREMIVFASYDEVVESTKNGGPKNYPPTIEAVRCAPRYTSIDDALADEKAGGKALWLNIDVDETLPPDVMHLTNLEWLEVSSPSLRALPRDLAKLTRLRRLDIDWCYSLETLPPEILGIETLSYMSMYDCRSLGPAYHMGRMNNLLGGFVRSKASSFRRTFEANLMLGRLDRALSLATSKKGAAAAKGAKGVANGVGDLLVALDNNVGAVREEAMRGLLRELPNPFANAKTKTPKATHSLGKETSFAVIGRVNVDKKQLASRLEAYGARFTTRIEESTTHVIVGVEPHGKQALIGDRAIVLETHLLPFISAAPEGPTASKEKNKKKKGSSTASESVTSKKSLSMTDLTNDLCTRNEDAVMRAVSAMKEQGAPKELFVHLLIVAQDVTLKKSRDEAKKLLAIHAPASLNDAAKAHLKSSLLLESLGETKRAERLRTFCNAAGVIDPLELAELLALRARVGLKYLFENAPSARIVRVLAAIATKIDAKSASNKAAALALDLSTLELDEVPKELAQLSSVEALDLSANHLSKWPEPVLAMQGLLRLDLSCNHITKIPDAAAKMKLTALDMGANRMRKFPRVVLEMKTLEELDLSNSQDYVENEARIIGVPDEIAGLTKLRKFHYAFNILDPFPSGLTELRALEDLRLFQCDLPKVVPSELKKLSKLQLLNVDYSGWESKKADLEKVLPKKCVIET